jgi:hypothetical protein
VSNDSRHRHRACAQPHIRAGAAIGVGGARTVVRMGCFVEAEASAVPAAADGVMRVRRGVMMLPPSSSSVALVGSG